VLVNYIFISFSFKKEEINKRDKKIKRYPGSFSDEVMKNGTD